jgi:hypothetical protein
MARRYPLSATTLIKQCWQSIPATSQGKLSKPLIYKPRGNLMDVDFNGLRRNIASSFNDFVNNVDFDVLPEESKYDLANLRMHIAFLLLLYGSVENITEMNPDSLLVDVPIEENS